jgi:hypothetical protein
MTYFKYPDSDNKKRFVKMRKLSFMITIKINFELETMNTYNLKIAKQFLVVAVVSSFLLL